MQRDSRRITLVTTPCGGSDRGWDFSNPIGSRLIFVGEPTLIPFALRRGVTQDVVRVIVDRTGTAEEYLDLLTELPGEFLGDVVYVRPDGGGYLSSVGQGGKRLMFSLTSANIDFYLQTNNLVWSVVAESASEIARESACA